MCPPDSAEAGHTREAAPSHTDSHGPDLPQLRGEVAFRLLVDAVQDYAIFLLDPRGYVLSWNLGAQRIKQYAANEIIGQHFSIFYTPEERKAGRPMRLLRWAAKEGRFEDEGWRVRKDGTRFWADVIVTALRDEHGEPYAYAKVTRDLTERREAEQQQRTLLAEQRARAAAEEALLARDRFLTIASHELKTPVATLQLSTESLLRARDTGRLDDGRLEANLRRIGNATRRLTALVNELLDVSQLTANRPTFAVERMDVVALGRDVIGRFAGLDDGRRIELEAPAELWIEADASRLDQVLTNLLDNAIKYSMPPAPIGVRIVPAPDDGVEISVLDEGIGVEQETADRIFEAFGRGPNAEHYQGLGLGLYISQQIVERHGGRIEARPREDTSGTIFTVWLPCGGPAQE